MRPLVSLIHPPILTDYIPPDDLDFTDLECWQRGGIALSDGNSGLEYQVWHLSVLGTGPTTEVWLDAPNTPPTLMFAQPGITWARFSFDQNMHPVIAFMADTGIGFWWWDPTINTTRFTYLASTVIKPCVTMDDKRALQTKAGNNDVVICYIDSGSIKFRLERDRYNVEYTWLALTFPYTYLQGIYINKIGMTLGLRLRLEIRGVLDP